MLPEYYKIEWVDICIAPNSLLVQLHVNIDVYPQIAFWLHKDVLGYLMMINSIHLSELENALESSWEEKGNNDAKIRYSTYNMILF